MSSLGDDRHSWGKRLSGIHKTSHSTPLIVNKCIHAKSHQLYPTLWVGLWVIPNYSHPGSCVNEILQARILEWFAISFSRASSQLRDWTHIFYVSCICRQVLYRCTTWEALLIYLFFSLLMSPIGEHSYGTQISLHFLPIQRGSSHFFPRFWSHKVSSHISSKLRTISQTSGHSPSLWCKSHIWPFLLPTSCTAVKFCLLQEFSFIIVLQGCPRKRLLC